MLDTNEMRQTRTWSIQGDLNPGTWLEDSWARNSTGFIFSANDFFHKYVAYLRKSDPALERIVTQFLDSLVPSENSLALGHLIEFQERLYDSETAAEEEDETRTQDLINRVVKVSPNDRVTVEDLESSYYAEDSFSLRLQLAFLDDPIPCRLGEKSWRHMDDEFSRTELSALRQDLVDSLTMLCHLPKAFVDRLAEAALHDYRETCGMTDVYLDDDVADFDLDNPLNINTPADAGTLIVHEETHIDISDPHKWQGTCSQRYISPAPGKTATALPS